MKTSLAVIMGLLGGAVIGYAFGAGARKNTASNVATEYKEGVVIISADVGNIAKQSASELVSGWF